MIRKKKENVNLQVVVKIIKRIKMKIIKRLKMKIIKRLKMKKNPMMMDGK